MNIITTRGNSVTINEGVITDNKGYFAIRRKGDVVLVNHKASGIAVSGTAQEYICDGLTFTDIIVLYNWLEDNLFYDGGGSGEGLQKATSSDVAAGTDDTKYVTAKSVNEFVISATQGEMANYINVLSATPLIFNESGFYTFNGSAPVTWALKPVSGNQGLHYYVKNIGSANLNITGVIYFTSSVNTIALAPGDAIIIHNNTSNWTIQ